MKNLTFIQAFTYVFLFTPFVLLTLYWQSLPAEIPTHWGVNGKVDDYGDKLEILMYPLLTLGVYVLTWGLVKIDPKKNISKYKSTLDTLLFAIVAFMTVSFVTIFCIAMGWFEPALMPNLLTHTMPIFFIVLGNYMGKIRPNYFLGIRTPWTLESEEVWIKTHRLTGKIWVILGFAFLIILLAVPSFKTIIFAGFIISIGLATIFLYFYSYWLFKDLESKAK